jgi:hypothetical protein
MALNAAEELSTAISRALPDATVTIDAPAHETGQWWIDITREDQKATVEWRPKHGFGVGLGPGGYGEGPDIVVPTVDAAVRQVLEYLLPDSIAARREATVLVASGDHTWRSAIEEHLRLHDVRADGVATLAEARNRVLKKTYVLVVADIGTEPSDTYWDFRDSVMKAGSLVITVATSDHVSAFDETFQLILHKRIGTENVASVIEGLVAAAHEREDNASRAISSLRPRG